MKTNYLKFDLYPRNGQALHATMKASLMQLIGQNNQTASLNGTYYSVHHISNDVFMFLKTNNTDIIKTIDRVNNSYQDISALLQANEEVAFASYFITKPTCIGFSSTIFGPKIGAFATYYDHYFFNANGGNNLRFEPISKTITPAQALAFPHMGKINVRLEKNSPFAIREMTNFLGVTALAFDDVDSFEIIIKPKRAKNIRDTIAPTLANMPQGIIDMTIAAKHAIGSQAEELHIAASGCVYDIVNTKSNTPLHLQMDTNFNQNADLRAAGY
ncbi:hypothetical protein [Enterobacter ludwigii]|uniref:hypothetical protein n=1 Tax=Enterobacter ludwigii TaxID=299767 RepID=UPI002ACAEA88|nr:hypothetical protein [Enterobacter ludwigii]MDZ5701885.1 hypothetical protein [Enterobacter ludwigii]